MKLARRDLLPGTPLGLEAPRGDGQAGLDGAEQLPARRPNGPKPSDLFVQHPEADHFLGPPPLVLLLVLYVPDPL